MRIVFWGHGERSQVCLQRIIADGFNIAAVIAQSDEKPRGRFPTLVEQAQSANITHRIISNPKDPAAIEWLRGLSADLFVLGGYAKIIPPAVVAIPPMGIINLHGGKIPHYRGTAPIPWQIINGETELGLTILYADEGIDTGAVLMERTYSLTAEEGATEAVEQTYRHFPEMLSIVLAGLRDGTLKGRPQDLSEGAYYTKRNPEDGAIDPRLMTAEYIFNLIRALRPPYPGAFVWRGAEKIILHRAQLLPERIHGVPGTIPLRRPNGVVLIAQDRGLLLTEVRTASDEILPAGAIFKVGDRLTAYGTPYA